MSGRVCPRTIARPRPGSSETWKDEIRGHRGTGGKKAERKRGPSRISHRGPRHREHHVIRTTNGDSETLIVARRRRDAPHIDAGAEKTEMTAERKLLTDRAGVAMQLALLLLAISLAAATANARDSKIQGEMGSRPRVGEWWTHLLSMRPRARARGESPDARHGSEPRSLSALCRVRPGRGARRWREGTG